jgi:chitin disaccharide deacetylase
MNHLLFLLYPQLLALLLRLLPFEPAMLEPAPTKPTTLILRCDDMGMSNAVNRATAQLIASGIPFSSSVMFSCPWYLEAVEILKANPQVAVGVHLTLGSEWKNYRWGPITSRDRVPSLVDSLGYFHPNPKALLAHNPRLEEIELEFRAQIERALGSGLKIDYLDNHMGAGMYNPEQRALVLRLANEYGLGISRYFGEEGVAMPSRLPFRVMQDSVVARISRIKPGTDNLLVVHLGLHPSEMDAMTDTNEGGTPQMSRQRQLELNLLRSSKFKKALQRHNVQLITYRDLIAREGRENMRERVR